MIRIGPYSLKSRAVLAPMAGVTDQPFRKLCQSFGAAAVTAEMTSAKPELRSSLKSRLRRADWGDPEPRIIQIVGTNPREMAEAARYQTAHGAQIIDINMGCPAKKVCKKLAGSALLKDERLVADILEEVVKAVDVPVTLKIRTGWDSSSRNAVEIARIAENSGIQSLAIHGRTRACRFQGSAEYDTIAKVVQVIDIPVFANGDIESAKKAKSVLDYTGAAGVMIGRGAQGSPWIFSEINELLESQASKTVINQTKKLECLDTRSRAGKLNHNRRLSSVIKLHLRNIHCFYGPFGHDLDVKIARKHFGWYLSKMPVPDYYGPENKLAIDHMNSETGYTNIEEQMNIIRRTRQHFNQLTERCAQLEFAEQFFEELQTGETAA